VELQNIPAIISGRKVDKKDAATIPTAHLIPNQNRIFETNFKVNPL
jgi:hypothetical protein